MARSPHRPRHAARRTAPTSPATLGAAGVLTIFGIAGVATALGLSAVHQQFSVRDHQIEARRLQELAGTRRDDVRKLETQIGFLTRDESLREAALGPLGMVEPAADSVQDLEVDAQRAAEIAAAHDRARARLAAMREEYDAFGKEVR